MNQEQIEFLIQENNELKKRIEELVDEYEGVWTDDPLNPPSDISTHQKLLDLNDAKQDLEEHMKEVLEAIRHTMEEVHERMSPPPVDEEE